MNWLTVALSSLFIFGLIAMLVGFNVTGSQKYHDKNHTRHTELMCNHCTMRAYPATGERVSVNRRWPMRESGQPKPRGDG